MKDHLGSTRATVDQTGAVVGYDDYDPWGYALAGRTMATQWSSAQSIAENKFTGKERDDDFGINWDYFGARYYDAQIGRWMALDPLADKYPSLSPYNYSANNPVINVDRDGRWIDTVVDVAFIAYDIYDIAKTAISGEKVSATQYAALGADVAGALIPFATGGGAAVRAAGKADNLVEAAAGAEKLATQGAEGAAKLVRGGDKAAEIAVTGDKVFESLNNGMKISVDDALQKATDYLGEGYKEVAPGVYRSADGTKQVRMTTSDLTDKRGAQLNFEKGKTVTDPKGRQSFKRDDDGNKHIYINE